MKHLPLFIAVMLMCGILASGMAFATDRIDINTSPDLYRQLVEIDGIGNTLAERCTAYRDLHKPIEINELDKVPGIGPGKLKLIKKKFKGR